MSAHERLSPFHAAVREIRQAAATLGVLPVPVVAVAGSFQCGKSTLVGGLLERPDLFPSLPDGTPCVIRAEYGASFQASTFFGSHPRTTTSPEQYRSWLQGSRLPRAITLTLPCELLRSMTLVDTPGIGRPAEPFPEAALQAAAQADRVLYLFHQRGPDAADAHVLRLMSTTLSHWDFWVNANEGGGELRGVRLLADQFCQGLGARHPVQTVDVRDPGSARTLRSWLSVVADAHALRRSATLLEAVDASTLARLPEGLPLAAGESRLLVPLRLHRWRARLIAHATLDRLLRETAVPWAAAVAMLAHDTARYYLANALTGLGTADGAIGDHDIAEGKVQLQNLLAAFAAEEWPRPWVPGERIGEIAEKVRSERFMVAVTGGFSTGKSSYYNAVLGARVLPQIDEPATASVTIIEPGAGLSVTAELLNEVTVRLRRSRDGVPEEVKTSRQALAAWTADPDRFGLAGFRLPGEESILTAQALATRLHRHPVDSITACFRGPAVRTFPEGDTVLPGLPTVETLARLERFWSEVIKPEWALRIPRIRVTYPCTYLELASFVDLPGTDSIRDEHTAVARSFLPKVDVFLIFMRANRIWTQGDKEVVSALVDEIRRAPDKVYFVINKRDLLWKERRSEAGNRQAEETVLQTLTAELARIGIRQPRILWLAAKPALDRKLRGESDPAFEGFQESLRQGLKAFRGFHLLESAAHEAQLFAVAVETAAAAEVARAERDPQELRDAVSVAENSLKAAKASATLADAVVGRFNAWCQEQQFDFPADPFVAIADAVRDTGRKRKWDDTVKELPALTKAANEACTQALASAADFLKSRAKAELGTVGCANNLPEIAVPSVSALRGQRYADTMRMVGNKHDGIFWFSHGKAQDEFFRAYLNPGVAAIRQEYLAAEEALRAASRAAVKQAVETVRTEVQAAEQRVSQANEDLANHLNWQHEYLPVAQDAHVRATAYVSRFEAIADYLGGT